MSKITNKIGARTLSKDEIKMVLPTYDKLTAQIEEMRLSVSGNNSKGKTDKDTFSRMQKTNNIGILGERGTGKTSIIKTLFKELETQNEPSLRNIILPVVVPENMSDSMNLMSTILGLFKIEVDKIELENEKDNQRCWEHKKSPVAKKYNDLVKKFCYIQPEFRNVSVDQYTTETDYVRKSSEIYNSDIDFLNCFNEFIELLLKNNGGSEDQLIFLFIDDIDLSTHRCVDVVKTLLSYISHERIVTILSGDLETFEEALTIDFVRQENALNGKLLDATFLNSSKNSTLLERKKKLAFEYLKKIVPPVYRHNVKTWSLADRGNYFVESEDREDGKNEKDEKDGKGGKDNKNVTLAELLTDTFKDFKCASLFQYWDYNSEKETLKTIPQSYYLFDVTARGLNNVYNVLLQTKEVIAGDGSENDQYIQIKILLETIVASNARLDAHRDVLFEKIIHFGVDFNSTVINCENFLNIVYLDLLKIKVYRTPEQKKDCFMQFVFLDFALRVLKKDQNSAYPLIKTLAMIDLMNTPSISGSMVTLSDIQITEEDTNPLAESTGISKDVTAKRFFLNLNFDEAITYYQYLTVNKYDIFSATNEKNKKTDSTKETDNKLREQIVGLYNTFRSVSALNPNVSDIHVTIAQHIKFFNNEFLSIFKSTSAQPLVNTVRLIFGDTFIFDKCIENAIENPYYNFLVAICNGSVFKDGKLVPLEETKYVNSKDETIKIICSIDKNKLWNNELSNVVKTYIVSKIKASQKEIVKDKHNIIDVTNVIPNCKKFEIIFKGKSETRAKKFESTLNKLGYNDREKICISPIDYNTVLNAANSLATSCAWYGIREAFDISNDLKNSYLIFADNKEATTDNPEEGFFINEAPAGIDETKLTEYVMWLHFYASYTVADKNMDNVYITSEGMAKFTEAIRKAYTTTNDIAIMDYKTIITKDLGKEAEYLDDFNEIFALIKDSQNGVKKDA